MDGTGATATLRASVRARGPRYLGVTLLNVGFGQLLLLALQVVLPDDRRALANALSVVICAVPTYWIHRRWVWEKRGRSALRTEILPFWAFVALGLVASTVAVAAAQAAWRGATGEPLPVLVTNAINIGTFFVIWALRFFWMDRAFGFEREP